MREWRNWQTRTFEGRVDSPYGFKSRFSHQQKTHFCLPTKVRFLNDVCLRQMMLAPPMMTASPNDVCLTAHWANIASLRHKVAQHHICEANTSYRRRRCIIERMLFFGGDLFCEIRAPRKSVNKELPMSRTT